MSIVEFIHAYIVPTINEIKLFIFEYSRIITKSINVYFHS